MDDRTAELKAVNEDLSRALRTKDEFLANMSHELRTPLSSILMLTEALKDQVYGELNERQLRCLVGVRDSGKHLLALINDILDLSKIDAGHLRLEPERLRAADVCESAIRMVKQAADRKRVTVTSRVPDDLQIRADRRRLKQMLVNLLSNAVKFTDGGGRVTLSVEADDDQVVLRVTDTGVGISQADIDTRLFKPFTQLDGSLARHHEGTGLGLTLVKQLAALHGGTVSVESEPGRGSTFTVCLPIRHGKDEPPEEWPVSSDTETREVGDGTLLLVEDNAINREAVCDYLTACGYKVHSAGDGPTALERSRSGDYSLILMDVQLPGLDGLEVIRRLKADTRTASIPVIAVTALAMKGDRERCLAAGADDYLAKPISLKALVAKIETYLKPDASGSRPPSSRPDSSVYD